METGDLDETGEKEGWTGWGADKSGERNGQIRRTSEDGVQEVEAIGREEGEACGNLDRQVLGADRGQARHGVAGERPGRDRLRGAVGGAHERALGADDGAGRGG